MKTRKVGAAGWLASGDSMGTLVNEGIMTKDYVQNWTGEYDIYWTLHENANVIIDNGMETIRPGETVMWEK